MRETAALVLQQQGRGGSRVENALNDHVTLTFDL